jgi:hypothetical protein
MLTTMASFRDLAAVCTLPRAGAFAYAYFYPATTTADRARI